MGKSVIRKETDGLGSSVAKGTAICLLGALAGGAGISCMIIRGTLKETAIGYSAMGILIISTILGVIPAVKGAYRRKLPAALITGACYFLTLALLNIILFDGIFTGIGTTMFVIISSAVAGFLLAGKPKTKQTAKKRRHKHG
jgi:hypothetical protein